MVPLFVFFYVIPCIIMCLPRFSEAYPQNWTVERGFLMARIYFWCVWVGVPLSGGAIALWHVLTDGRFSPVLILEAALAMPLYLLRMEGGWVCVLSLSVLLVLLVESFALLGGCEPTTGREKPGLLAGAAKNRKFLARLCFWSIVVIGVIQIACSYLAPWGEMPSPLILLPLPLVLFLLPLFHLKDAPLTAGGMAGAFLLFALSALLSTTFHMNRFWPAHLMFVAIGYGLLFLVEGLAALVRFFSARR